ncbi:unnamed protein product [Arctogadus glacialis]
MQRPGSGAPGAGSRHGERFVVENRGRAVSLIPHGGRRLVFGQRGGGAVIQLGQASIFRLDHPTEAAQLRQASENLAPPMLLHPRQPTLARSGALMETRHGERVISFGDGGGGGVPPRPISSR